MSDFFEDKPDWFRGYATALASEVVLSDIQRDSSGFGFKASKLAKHMAECSIQDIQSLDDEVEPYEEYDSYNEVHASLEATVTVKFTCACGEYTGATAYHRGTLGELIGWVTRGK